MNKTMKTSILEIEEHDKGKLFTLSVGRDKKIRILFLFHALERMLKWQLTPDIVAETMLLPEEIVRGHRNRYIAHKRYEKHLVRAVYEYEREMPVLITVYFPYVDRYFMGGGIYEDKIF